MKLSPESPHHLELRARPSVPPSVILHVDPRAVTRRYHLPDAAFQIAHIHLDPRRPDGRRCASCPRRNAPAPAATTHRAAVGAFALLPSSDPMAAGIEVKTAATAHMTIQLLAAFDLAGVQLSPTFGVSHFALRARRRGGKVRAILPGHAGFSAGITFAGAHVLLDASAQIAEVSLDAIIP